MIALRTSLLLLALLGVALFGVLLALSIRSPGFVEEIAKEMIRLQVEEAVHERIEALDANFLFGKAASLLKRNQSEIEAAERELRDKVPERLAAVIGEMRNLDCECRRKIERGIRDAIAWHIESAAQAQERLTTFIQVKYMEVAEKLTREFRIFTGTNTAVFALLGFSVITKRRAGLHLVPAAVVLLLAAAVTGYLYLFKQDWLHTILFSDYVGFTYVGYLTLVFAILCDVLFNKGRITTEVLNTIFRAVGSSFQVVPC